MPILLADPPTHIETRQISGCERPHRHAEVVECLIDHFHGRSLFNHELRLASIWMKHSIADKPATVADQHAYLSKLLGELHAGSNDVFAGQLATHNLQKAHDICRAEEVCADQGLRTRRSP